MCLSCNAKRAHVTAVHLVESVLPRVPYRVVAPGAKLRPRGVPGSEEPLLVEEARDARGLLS